MNVLCLYEFEVGNDSIKMIVGPRHSSWSAYKMK